MSLTTWAAIALMQLLVADADAKSVMTATCDEPKGPRVDYGGFPAQKSGQPLNHSWDSFTGVYPAFIIDDADPKRLTYVFGNTKAGGDLGAKPARAAIVIVGTDEMISAVDVGSNSVAIFTLYPKAGVGFFTYHEAQRLAGGDATAVTYIARCSFAT